VSAAALIQHNDVLSRDGQRDYIHACLRSYSSYVYVYVYLLNTRKTLGGHYLKVLTQ